jgi:hypothetical protein
MVTVVFQVLHLIRSGAVYLCCHGAAGGREKRQAKPRFFPVPGDAAGGRAHYGADIRGTSVVSEPRNRRKPAGTEK